MTENACQHNSGTILANKCNRDSSVDLWKCDCGSFIVSRADANGNSKDIFVAPSIDEVLEGSGVVFADGEWYRAVSK